MSTRQDGWTAGAEAARADLVRNQRIAAKWATERLRFVAAAAPTTEYGQGYVAGYRSVLTTAADACEGGTCTTIDHLCSKHQAQYQRRYGRASNE